MRPGVGSGGGVRPPCAVWSQRGPECSMPQISNPPPGAGRTPMSERWYFTASASRRSSCSVRGRGRSKMSRWCPNGCPASFGKRSGSPRMSRKITGRSLSRSRLAWYATERSRSSSASLGRGTHATPPFTIGGHRSRTKRARSRGYECITPSKLSAASRARPQRPRGERLQRGQRHRDAHVVLVDDLLQSQPLHERHREDGRDVERAPRLARRIEELPEGLLHLLGELALRVDHGLVKRRVRARRDEQLEPGVEGVRRRALPEQIG